MVKQKEDGTIEISDTKEDNNGDTERQRHKTYRKQNGRYVLL